VNHVKELISEYIDDELSDSERQLVENHLNTCDECRNLTEELLSMKQSIFSTYQSIEIPDGLEQKVMVQVNKQPWLSLSVSVLFLFILSSVLTPFLSFSVGLASSLTKIGFSLLQVIIPTMIYSVPYLLSGIYTFALILLFLSIWSLRRLLILHVE